MRVIKEIMAQRVGYENLPMACLSGIPNSTEVSGESVLSVLPMNSRNSVIFQLEMPEDMILSISFSTLLDISNQANEINDPQSSEFDFCVRIWKMQWCSDLIQVWMILSALYHF